MKTSLKKAFGVSGLLVGSLLLGTQAASAQQVPDFSASGTDNGASATQPAATSLGGGYNGAPQEQGRVHRMYIPLNKVLQVDLPTRPADVVIGRRSVADVEVSGRPQENNERVSIRAEGIGTTNILFLDGRGQLIQQLEIHVTVDPSGVQTAIGDLLPTEPISVTAHRDSIFLSGGVRSATAATQAVNIANRFVDEDVNVVNMIRILGSQQVVIQVRVAEMQRSVGKSLGFDTTLSRTAFGNRNLTLTSNGTDGISSLFSGSLELGVLGLAGMSFRTLENQGLAKTLAEPTLTALSGQTATFLSGGETPVPTSIDTNGNIAVEYRDFGIQLGFTPTVQDEGRINLQLSVAISTQGTNVTINNTALPQFTTKSTQTSVDLPSGGSIMISGLLQNDSSVDQNGPPLLKDIPLLGTLFRKSTQSQTERELVVMVTAYLAKPIDDPNNATLPTDGMKPATDLDLFILGKIYGTYTGDKMPVLSEPLDGPFGYIME